MKFIGLFAGAGGLDYGFKLVGFKPVILTDCWQPAVDTLRANNIGTDIYNWDVKELTEDQIVKALAKAGTKPEEIDLITGGPPCQAFSRLNQNQLFDDGQATEDNVNDPRRSLFMDFLRIVDYIKPKMVIMENVADIAVRKLGGDTIERDELIVDIISREFNNIDYNVVFSVLKAVNYGVPQRRKRMIFIGTRIGCNIKPFLPIPVALETTVEKELAKITEDSPNNKYKEVTEEWKLKVSKIPPKGYYKHLPVELKVLKPVTIDWAFGYKGQVKEFCFENKDGVLNEFLIKKDRTVLFDNVLYEEEEFINVVKNFKVSRIMPRMGTYLRRSGWDIAHTITRNPLIHPGENREMSVREKAAVQTFPSDYEFFGSIADQHILVGNAVPCNLAKNLALHVKELLDK